MASFSPAFISFSTFMSCKKHRFFHQSFQVKAQSYRSDHEGRPNDNFVDSNLKVLKQRIEEVRNKERLERFFVAGSGWNYTPFCDFKQIRNERNKLLFLKLAGIICGTSGFTILSCSFCLFVISLLLNGIGQL